MNWIVSIARVVEGYGKGDDRQLWGVAQVVCCDIHEDTYLFARIETQNYTCCHL